MFYRAPVIAAVGTKFWGNCSMTAAWAPLALILAMVMARPVVAATQMDLPVAQRGNPADAMNQFNIRAETGDIDAQVFMAELYRLGIDVDINPKKAFSWYIRAARRGNPRAQSKVGAAFMHGLGIPQDYQKANRWCLKAARNGDTEAIQNLGRIYADGMGVTPNPSLAYMWYTIGARMGDEKSRSLGSSVRYKLTNLEIQHALDMVNAQLTEIKGQ